MNHRLGGNFASLDSKFQQKKVMNRLDNPIFGKLNVLKTKGGPLGIIFNVLIEAFSLTASRKLNQVHKFSQGWKYFFPTGLKTWQVLMGRACEVFFGTKCIPLS